MSYMEICPHGKITVEKYVQTGACKNCGGKEESVHFVPNIEEKYNHGLGCYTSGTRDAEAKAKRRGLVPIGDAKANQVFKNEKRDDITPILEEGRRKLHNLGSI